jgi:hypothetical protein
MEYMEENKNQSEEKDILAEADRKRLDPPSEDDFTKAMETMSPTDRDIFENTKIIHVDRNQPAETQAMHVVKLQKKHEHKRNTVYRSVIILMVAGVCMAGLGLFLNETLKNQSQTADSSQTTDGADKDTVVAVNETNFPDALFRSYIEEQIDKDSNSSLSADELNSALIMKIPADTAITNLKGIELFPLLQSLTISSTGVQNVDLSKNTELTYLNISGSPIASLDLSMNTKLTELDASNSSLASLTLPQKSAVKTVNVTGTALSCSKSSEGTYTSCK